MHQNVEDSPAQTQLRIAGVDLDSANDADAMAMETVLHVTQRPG